MSEAYGGNSYDISAEDGGPRRPALADFGGATVEDDDEEPNKAVEIYADMINGLQHGVAALHKTNFVLAFALTYSAGTPSVAAFSASNTIMDLSSFTVVDEGPGIALVKWDEDLITAAILPGFASMTEDAAWANPIVIPYSDSGTHKKGVRVKTRNASGVATDGNCIVVLF